MAENTLIYVPILEMNRNTDFWGSDAASFNPDRWLQSKLPEGARELPSIAMPSFLAGPRACIGFRFALIESVPRTQWSIIYESADALS